MELIKLEDVNNKIISLRKRNWWKISTGSIDKNIRPYFQPPLLKKVVICWQPF